MRDVDLRRNKALLRLGNETGDMNKPHVGARLTQELLLHVAFARLAQRLVGSAARLRWGPSQITAFSVSRAFRSRSRRFLVLGSALGGGVNGEVNRRIRLRLSAGG
jgi:hypothetical protein